MFRYGAHHRSGFTLIELLIVIGIIGTLASVTIVAINPNKQLGAAKDAARLSAIKELQNALSQYVIDNGSFPTGVSAANPKAICKQGVVGDATCITLDSALIPKYLSGIPQDSAETHANYSGYMVTVLSGRPKVMAPYLGNNTITNGLIGYWKFDEGTGTAVADYAENGNTGTLANGPTWTSGKLGGALQFVSTLPTMTVPFNSIFDLGTGDFSISLWVKTSTAVYQSLFMRNALLNNDGVYIYVNQTDGATRTWVAGTPFNGTTSFTTGNWAHIAIVRSQGIVTHYVNGVAAGSISAPDTISSPPNSPIVVGGSYPSNFVIDDLRFYNRALSPSELQLMVAGNG